VSHLGGRGGVVLAPALSDVQAIARPVDVEAQRTDREPVQGRRHLEWLRERVFRRA